MLMTYRPGDIVNRHILNQDGTAWTPLTFASNWDRWAGFGIALTDTAVRAESGNQEGMFLWTDCYGVFAAMGLNGSAALALWRKCALMARFVTSPGARVVPSRRDAGPVWTSYSLSLSALERALFLAGSELDAVLPAELKPVVLVQFQLMTMLTVKDAVKKTRRARVTYQQMNLSLQAMRQAAYALPLVETWAQADNPGLVLEMLKGIVHNPALTKLAEPRPAGGGPKVRDVKEMIEEPISIVNPDNIHMYPPHLLAF